MNILQTFIEGLISFVSPCMLPLLPVYVTYFSAGEAGKRDIFLRAFAFMVGFTVVFVALGVFAGSLGAALAAHRMAVNVVCGVLVILMTLLSQVISAVSGGEVNFLNALTGLLVPILYVIGAFKNQRA